MLSLLKPRCPVDIREKVWTERRMHWLSQRFGLERMVSAPIVLPTREFFPDPYSGADEDIEPVFQRVCDLMGVAADDYTLPIRSCCDGGGCCPPEPGEEAVGAGKPVVDLGGGDLADQERVIAGMARTISRQMLLTGEHLNGTEEDFDSVTDLLAVFLGLGIFQANSAVRSTAFSQTGWEYWSIRGAGCLQARVPGYAMALMAWVRNERSPSWSRMLGTDAGSAFQRGYRYVTKTRDCLFHPDNAGRPSETRSNTSVVSDLERGTETQQLAAVWQLMEDRTGPAEAMKGLSNCVLHKNPLIQAEAARAVAAIGPLAEPALPAVIEKLSATEAETRAYCAAAIGNLAPPLDARPDGLEVGEELSMLLEDRNTRVSAAALGALAEYGAEAEALLKKVVPAMARLARDCDFGMLGYFVMQVARISPDPEAFLTEHLEHADPEIRDRVLEELNPPEDMAAEG